MRKIRLLCLFLTLSFPILLSSCTLNTKASTYCPSGVENGSDCGDDGNLISPNQGSAEPADDDVDEGSPPGDNNENEPGPGQGGENSDSDSDEGGSPGDGQHGND